VTTTATRPYRLRNALQREVDIAKIEELHLRGMTVSEISKELNLTRNQVDKDLDRIVRKYSESTLRNYNADLNRQLRKLDLLERTAWQFLAGSEKDREITTTRQRTKEVDRAEEFSVREASRRTEQRDPDSRYMTVIQWCIAERNRLLSLYPTEDTKPQTHVAVTEIVYELAPQQRSSGMTIIGGGTSAPSLKSGQIEVIGGNTPESEEPMSVEELWGVEEDPLVPG
jgi:hypothetical protein